MTPGQLDANACHVRLNRSLSLMVQMWSFFRLQACWGWLGFEFSAITGLRECSLTQAKSMLRDQTLFVLVLLWGPQIKDRLGVTATC